MYSSSQRHFPRSTGSENYAHRNIHYSHPYLASDYDAYHNDLYRNQSSDYEINPSVYGSKKGSVTSSCQITALDNTEERGYQSDDYYCDKDDYTCGNDDSVCIIDDVETFQNQSVEVIDLDCSIGDGSDLEHRETVVPIDDFIVVDDAGLSLTSPFDSPPHRFTASEAAIDALLSLGRQGLLETVITQSPSPYPTYNRNIQICKFFLKGACKYGASGKYGGMCRYIHLNSSLSERIGSRPQTYGGSFRKQHNKSVFNRLKGTPKGAPKRLQRKALKQVQQWIST